MNTRLKRVCVYDEGTFTSATTPNLASESPAVLSEPWAATVIAQFRTNALSALGSVDKTRKMSRTYFSSTHFKLAILSEKKFYERLPSLFVSTSADLGFTTLCLCMHLAQQNPSPSNGSMLSSLYVLVKTVLYEVGHGIYPAASISMASCARAARNLGLHKIRSQPLSEIENEVAEERRTWWAVHNLDRFINLYNGDAIFNSEDAGEEDPLPPDDGPLSLEPLPYIKPTIATPALFRLGQFARECQVAHLVGRVVRHVFSPISDVHFHEEEATQLARTLLSFLPLLIEEEVQFSNYCGALSTCISSLFTLYAAPSLRSQSRTLDENTPLFAMEQLSAKMAEISDYIFGMAQDENKRFMLSPFVPYALYQTAVIELRLWKQKGEPQYKERADRMIQILWLFSKRWSIAGKYIAALYSPHPPVTLPAQDFYISENLM
ncbi:uncharacterized protein N7473_011460 [Penicillium subrubescens]|uniref:uncharacterized protein n=1 Tax=Penicillium subrubescens TaxID=1316194 RepID=UPI0025455259|nr:uncharacterized protein N7473_011460 [Penicillium subrubescens]KAJ5880407.1 hypothetical protein N7473_011460 [Penicillium subrubescens]